MKKLITLFALAWIACMCPAISAQEATQTNRTTDLRAAPDFDSALIQSLPEKTTVQVLKKEGAWSQVKFGAKTGYVRMMHLRGGSTVVTEQQTSGGGFMASMNKLFLGDRERTGQTRQGATVGIRGITEQDLRDAELNPVALAKMKTFIASEGAARNFATQGKLAFRSVAYIAKDAILAAEASGGKK